VAATQRRGPALVQYVTDDKAALCHRWQVLEKVRL